MTAQDFDRLAPEDQIRHLGACPEEEFDRLAARSRAVRERIKSVLASPPARESNWRKHFQDGPVA